MARAGIIYSNVVKAAAKLAADGKNPTVDNVREALGGTGSKSTIAPLLKRWKAENQETMVKTELGIPVELLHAVKGVYEKLQADIAQKLEQAQQAHQAELQTVADNAQRLKADNQAFSEASTALSTESQRAKDAMARLQAEQHALNITLATVQSENTGLQQRLTDRAAEVAALNQQLTQARAQFEHYQEATAAQRSEERQAAEQRIARLEQELAGTQHRLAAQQSTIGQQEAQLSLLTAENSRVQHAVDAAQEELGQTRLKREQLSYQVKEITAAHQDIKGRHDTMQQALAETRTALAVQTKETLLLAERFVRTEEKSEKLAQEKLVLLQVRASLETELRQCRDLGKTRNK